VVKLGNKQRTGRRKSKELKEPKEKLRPAERKSSVQDVHSTMEVRSDKEVGSDKQGPDNTEHEFEGSRPLATVDRQPEPPVELTSQQGQHQQTEQPEVEQTHKMQQERKRSGGKRVADNREGIFESVSKMNESIFSLDAMKKAAAWYIETSEKFANQAIEVQERVTGWAKDTPLAPLFEAQSSFARKFVERSANAARTMWQIQPS
jgi:hypothetical protein